MMMAQLTPTCHLDPSRRLGNNGLCRGRRCWRRDRSAVREYLCTVREGPAAGAPVEVDVSDLAPGQMRTVEWRGKPVWIIRRTDDQLKGIKSQDGLMADPNSERPGFTPAYAKNEYRSRKPGALCLCRHLHAPGLFAHGAFRNGWRGRHARQLAKAASCAPATVPSFDMAGRV